MYQAPNTTFGALDEYAKIVNDNVDQIVTSSWGLCEQAVQQGSPGIQQAENIIFQQAAAQGQTVFSAAGDAGSNDCNAFLTTSPVNPVRRSTTRRASRTSWPPAGPPSKRHPARVRARLERRRRLGRGRRRHLRGLADADLAARFGCRA